MSSKEESIDNVDATCAFESFSKVYRVKVSNYSQIKQSNNAAHFNVGNFDLAGHSWAIFFNPCSICDYNGYVYISFLGNLLTETSMPLTVEHEFLLLNQDGTKTFKSKTRYQMVKQKGNGFGVNYLMDRRDFESSEYLKDDCFTIQCSLRVVKPSCIDLQLIKKHN